MVKLCYGVPVVVHTDASTEYTLTAAALRTTLEANPEVRCIILCNPSNPTGAVMSAAALEEIAAVLREFPKVIDE